jgi:ribonucleoside-triphosphate reductase
MWIKQSYDDQFEHFMLDMKDKYPRVVFELEGISDDSFDVTNFAKRYFLKKNVADVSVDANANVQIKNIATFKTEVHKGLDKLNSLYLLWKTAKKMWGTSEANKLCEKELNKDLNVQDFSNFFLSYCFAFDTIDLVTQGLPFITNKPSSPAKHADTFLRHVEQLVMFASRQMMGATAIPNVLVIYSALLKKDLNDKNYHLSVYKDAPKQFDKFLRQEFQKFIYTINQPIRDVQSPFTNITIFDSIFLKELCKTYIINGECIDADFAMVIQKKFLEFFNEFNKESIFTFPVLTAQFKKDSEGNIEDIDFLDFISKINLDFGHLNIFSAENLTALSSCCRLLSNVEDIIKATKEENFNLIGGSSIKVGSFGVTTVNLARIGLLAKKDKDKFFILLNEHARDAYRINHCRRQLIQDKITQDQMPLYTYGFMKLENQYSTLGITGLYEAVYFMGYDMASDENGGKQFAIDILTFLQSISEEKIKTYGYRCNIEQIPAEQTAGKLAKVDSILYKQDTFELYGNQFIPLTCDTDIINRIELQATFEKYFSGGTIMHVNLGEKIPTTALMKKIIKYVVKSGVQYFAINYFFQKCEDGHLTIDNTKHCIICGKKIIEKYTRIVGFLVPVSSWSEERRKEYTERKRYPEVKC